MKSFIQVQYWCGVPYDRARTALLDWDCSVEKVVEIFQAENQADDDDSYDDDDFVYMARSVRKK